jgi:type II secretory pathway pseudopilin PulG
VVIAIIGLLAALALPMLVRTWRNAGRTKLAADMSTIGMALDEYKKDFGDYPRVTQADTGFAVLGRALLGTYGDGNLPGGPPPPPDPDDPPAHSGTEYTAGDCVQSGATKYVALKKIAGPLDATPGPNQAWTAFNANDLADGPGTRLRAGGKKVGPYLQQDRFRVRGCGLLDANDNPILYFPAKAAKPNLSQVIMPGSIPPFVSQGKASLFDANDNLFFFKRFDDQDPLNAMMRIRAMLGDKDNNGLLDPGEEAASQGPYLLWAPGPDGFYGAVTKLTTAAPTASDISKCDDVTNFRP